MHEYWRNIKLHHMITKLLPIGEVVALGLIPSSKELLPLSPASSLHRQFSSISWVKQTLGSIPGQTNTQGLKI